MASLQLTVSVLGLGLALVILLLVRRDHLHLSHGLFWFSVAVVAALFGVWPSLVDRLATAAGIAYSPALVLLVGIMVLLLKALISDIALTRIERQLRRLNQRLALLEVDRTTQGQNGEDHCSGEVR